MILDEKSLRISDGCVKFTLVSQSGHCVQPVTMGRGAARNLAESILELLHLERRAAMNPAALDRMLEDTQRSEHLQERIAATVTAMSHDDLGDLLEGDRWDGLV